jgi:hypothetical protein
MSFSVAQLPNYIALDTWIRFYVSTSFRKYVSLKNFDGQQRVINWTVAAKAT